MSGAGAKSAIDGRCRELRKQIEKTTSDYDKEKLRERLAKLTGGVAVIRVGARPSLKPRSSRKPKIEKLESAGRQNKRSPNRNKPPRRRPTKMLRPRLRR